MPRWLGLQQTTAAGISGTCNAASYPPAQRYLPATSPAANTLIAASSALGRALHQDRPRDLTKLLSMQLTNLAIRGGLGRK